MRPIPLLLLLVAAGCTRPEPSGQVELAALIAGRTAQPPQTCVLVNSNQSLRAVDDSTLVYGWGSTIYINRLGGRCPGLSDFSTIIVDHSSGQYCRGDRIRALEPGSIIPGPTCNLGDWVAYRR